MDIVLKRKVLFIFLVLSVSSYSFAQDYWSLRGSYYMGDMTMYKASIKYCIPNQSRSGGKFDAYSEIGLYFVEGYSKPIMVDVLGGYHISVLKPPIFIDPYIGLFSAGDNARFTTGLNLGIESSSDSSIGLSLKAGPQLYFSKGDTFGLLGLHLGLWF